MSHLMPIVKTQPPIDLIKIDWKNWRQYLNLGLSVGLLMLVKDFHGGYDCEPTSRPTPKSSFLSLIPISF